jgi:filamentous hemagglutinin family protein
MKTLIAIGSALVLSLFSPRSSAQNIKPDGTLGNERSVVSPLQNVRGIPSQVITGGAARGSNLFQSFENFSIDPGTGAYFSNPTGIGNIITRVTGSSSRIDGVLGVLGNANLYFLNANGIVFGKGARLDLNGSFLASTASQIEFADSTVWSTRNSQPAPLLTIDAPIGLGLLGNEGKIQVLGTGHNYLESLNIFSPIAQVPPTEKLSVSQGRTLALVAGDLQFNGGAIVAPSGRIELGGVRSGSVGINPDGLGGFSLDYSQAKSFGNVTLSNRSLLDASGTFNGYIGIQGRDLVVTDRSLIYLQNRGVGSVGEIRLTATGLIKIIKQTPLVNNFPNTALGVRGETIWGQGPQIFVSANQLVLDLGGAITSSNFASGQGGDINIQASSVTLLGFTEIPFEAGSLIVVANTGSGRAGFLNVRANELKILDGGFIASFNASTGNTQGILVNVSGPVVIQGTTPQFGTVSSLGLVNIGSGSTGNLRVNSNSLSVRDGGHIGSSTLGLGSSGDIIINGASFVEVAGSSSFSPSSITSSASPQVLLLRILIDPPLPIIADSGNIEIHTDRLIVRDSAQITARNDGTGNAGTLFVNAPQIFLNSGGSITAATASGNGGEISIPRGLL